MRNFLGKIASTIFLANRILGWPLVILIKVYQTILSPDHGLLKPLYPYGYCKYYPTCSHYAEIVMKRQGVLGIPKIIKRLVSCNPRSMGGIDWPYNGKHI